MTWPLLLAAAALFLVSGLPSPRAGRALALLAALTGLAGLALGLATAAAPLDLAWPIPAGRFALALDPLSAAFLVITLVIPALGTVYASAYFPADHPTARRTRFAYGLLPAAMILVVLAHDAFLLLVAWEVMALSAFFLVIADDHLPEVRASGWVYLIATHVGTLCLIAAFALLSAHTGDLALRPVTGLNPTELVAIPLLFFVGFGTKAGLMPLHLWLPGAHANAPSHVSAVMSGVVIAMGVYGLARAALLLPELPASTGATLLALGAVTAVLGAALAAAQADLKRLLAYSSVDNTGIMAMGLGLAIIGRAESRPELVLLGLGGAVLHAWNHALFKPLLFFVAGSVVHATGTRQMDRLGGLARVLPRTALAAFIGAAALAALPPLNGFLGELFVYLGLFQASASDAAWPALAAPALALSGALALLAMVKLIGSVFLGTAREPLAVPHPHEPAAMVAPMAALAAACLAMAFVLPALAPWLGRLAHSFAPAAPPLGRFPVPLAQLAATLGLLLAAAAATALALRRWRRRLPAPPPPPPRGREGAGPPPPRPDTTAPPPPPPRRLPATPAPATWACGYAAPTPRIQYTSTSLSDTQLGLFRRLLWPRSALVPPTGAFPGPSAFTQDLPDPVLDRAALPTFRLIARAIPWLRRSQQGRLPIYLLYILAAAIWLLMGA